MSHRLTFVHELYHQRNMDPNGASTCIKVVSFVRGYHAYVDIWQPEIGEKRQLKREPSNIEDINSVAVVQERAGNAGNTQRKRDSARESW